jgi:hypothetical protein
MKTIFLYPAYSFLQNCGDSFEEKQLSVHVSAERSRDSKEREEKVFIF